jgi:hypothetical protein
MSHSTNTPYLRILKDRISPLESSSALEAVINKNVHSFHAQIEESRSFGPDWTKDSRRASTRMALNHSPILHHSIGSTFFMERTVQLIAVFEDIVHLVPSTEKSSIVDLPIWR